LAPLLSPSPSSPLASQGSALSDWFPCLKPIPRLWLTYCPDDGGIKHLWNISKLLPDYMVQHPRRQSSSYLLLWKPEISSAVNMFGSVFMMEDL
jgi:hypothetical protein